MGGETCVKLCSEHLKGVYEISRQFLQYTEKATSASHKEKAQLGSLTKYCVSQYFVDTSIG